MASTDGGGGSMDYEYHSQSMSGAHGDPMRVGGRISRCPALALNAWSSVSPSTYYGSPGNLGWHQSPYTPNHLTGYNPPQHTSFGYPAHVPARGPSLPNPLPEPRGSHSSHPQETAVPTPAVYTPTRYAGISLPDPSPPPVPAPGLATALVTGPMTTTSTTTTASSPSATSTSPNPAAARQVSPHARSQPIPAVDSSGADAYSSPSSPSSAPASQSRSATSSSAQLESQSPAVRPPPSQLTARVRLPAPGARQRMPSNDQRPRMTIGNYARYRDVADYLDMAEYEAAHAVASQTSDDDSDRDLGPRPYGSFGHAYLQTARQSQILRGQMNNKRVASKRAVQSLQKVDVDSLPETEKTCVICYNDFGVASPEGTVETPLRLPKCKHVFGNQCILKWLEESYSCPYCRDKLESEMARPDQETIRRMLTESEMTHLPPSIRPRVYRTQTSDRVDARAEAPSLLRARQRELEASRDSISRGERRAAPPEDSSDAQRRQRPRFSADGYNTSTTTALTQNASPAQRTPAWQHGTTPSNHWAMTPQYLGAGAPSNVHLAEYTLPSFAMTNPGFPHDFNGPNFPPMVSREDLYYGPQHSELAQMGFEVPRPGAAHDYTLPRPLNTFSRPHQIPGGPSYYGSHLTNNQQASSYPNMAQPVRSDGPLQGGAYSGVPNRN